MRTVIASFAIGLAASILASALILWFTGPALGIGGWGVVVAVFAASSFLGFLWSSPSARSSMRHIASGLRSGKSVNISGLDVKVPERNGNVSVLSNIKAKQDVVITDSNVRLGGAPQNEKPGSAN